MTNNIAKPVSEPASRTPGTVGTEEARRPTRDGEFDRVLDEKAGHRQSKKEDGEHQAGASADGQRPDEGQRFRALPGDVAISYPLRMEPVEVGPGGPVGAIDRVAEVQKIVDQIVEAAQVRLGPDGAAEARLELDLGSLGRVSVGLERTAEGQIRVGFETASVKAAELLQSRADDLAGRLEARGIALQEITVTGADQAVFRLEPPSATAAPESPRLPEPAARGAEARHDGKPFEGERGDRERRQPEREVPAEDE